MWLESCLWCWWASRCFTRSTAYYLRCSHAAWRTSATTAATGANSAARAWAVWYAFAPRSRKRLFALFASLASQTLSGLLDSMNTHIDWVLQVRGDKYEACHGIGLRTSAYHVLMPECSVSSLSHHWRAWIAVLCRFSLISLWCSISG